MPLVDSEHRRAEVVAPERPPREDPKRAANKIALFQYLTVAVFVFLVSGFWKLQVQNPDVYSEAAERNRIKSVPILAPRGRLLDRDGRVIVDNKASYSLLLNRDEIKSSIFPRLLKRWDWNLPICQRLGRREDPARPPVQARPIEIIEKIAVPASAKGRRRRSS